MKKTWFEHSACTHEEAAELLRRYRARGVRAEKMLAADYRQFIVRAELPEGKYPPRQSRTFQQPWWG
ncbi:hypothetical protein C5952_04915 [Cronobacter sakazakii]|uniref:hypothetical protein n=1 Tax=Cronobacter sakazakii TaxID=28141 RepID=UPI000CFC76DC|nr:hypothetical protein [Cronobacter sakazakii]ELY4673377.1 hypothetical protein [Cronobacter muytjensii]ELY6363052.1 hypothetical protein [Cronobacter sakazakii]PQX67351.1 hypothetical protein C5952_04915 [Cronobacter sakazakii]PQY05796.1 hypothetical protein C5936_10955 [Cronobacter sakazakii]